MSRKKEQGITHGAWRRGQKKLDGSGRIEQKKCEAAVSLEQVGLLTGMRVPIICCLMLLTMLLLIILNSCTGIFIARFDPVSLQNAAALKKVSLDLIDNAAEPYEQHRGEIEELFIKLEKARQHSLSIRKNSISVKQWEKIIDLLGRIFHHWQTSNQLSPVFIREAKKDVDGSFDEVIKQEKGKPGGRVLKNGHWSLVFGFWGCLKELFLVNGHWFLKSGGDGGIWQGAGCREQGVSLHFAPFAMRSSPGRSKVSFLKLSIVNDNTRTDAMFKISHYSRPQALGSRPNTEENHVIY